MNSKYRYTVVLEKDPEDGSYTVTVPALPGCVTEGDTVEDSLEMAKEAIAGHLESLILMKQVPAMDVNEVNVQVSEETEILIYKVDLELEPGIVETA